MKKKTMINRIYKNLQKNRTAIKIHAFLMAGLLFAINSFAWFVFVSNSDNIVKADVVEWEIEFFDEDTETSVMDITIDNLYPGMHDYIKSIKVRNSSHLGATFSYEIEELSIFGEDYHMSEDMETFLENALPFYIIFDVSKVDINKDESISFAVKVGWEYEQEGTYCSINELYPYNPLWNYYKLDEEEYIPIDISEEVYEKGFSSDIFTECDDLDSYWGEKSVIHKEENPEESAISLKLKLKVTQKEK